MDLKVDFFYFIILLFIAFSVYTKETSLDIFLFRFFW